MTPKVFESEYRFLLILWREEPINSTTLAKSARKSWAGARTTTYTVIKRLSDRGVVQNENATVTTLVSKEAVQTAQMDELMEKTFEGSVPAFLAAFRPSAVSFRERSGGNTANHCEGGGLTMEAMFLQLVNLSITAGWLVLAVLALRLLLRRAPKSILCAMWGLVGFGFCVRCPLKAH